MMVVNLLGGPGTGKSTLAAKIFAKLKVGGYNVEYVSEYAKDLVHEENYNLINSQIQVFAKQLWRLRRLKGKVDIIITDSPILLSLIYSKESNPFFKDFVLYEYNQFQNMTYFLERSDEIPYQEHGRYQNAEQAKEVDTQILDMLKNNNIDFKTIGVQQAKKHILRDIKIKFI